MALPAGKQKSRLADALLAEGPDPDYADALMLFGRFVGEWDVDWTAYDGDGRQVANERGEWIFDWVLEGRAVQDVWIIPARGRRGRPSREGEYGTTIRFYDPQLDVWLVTWSGAKDVRRQGIGLGHRSRRAERTGAPAPLGLLRHRAAFVLLAELLLA